MQSALREGAVVVTASQRLARVIRHEYNAAQRQSGALVWPAPRVMPWGAWIAGLWDETQLTLASPPAVLTAWQERVLWEAAVRASAESADLLQAGGAAATAQDAWRLAIEWRLDLARIEAHASEDSRMFAIWARWFERRCAGARAIDGARLPDMVRGALGSLQLPPRIALAGFDEFTPQQSEFWDACREAGSRVDPVAAPLEAPGEAVRVEFPDARLETEAAARWARACFQAAPGARIGIVVPDLAARRREVARIFRGVLEPAAQLPGAAELPALFHVSAGGALSAHPLVAGALALLSLSPQANEWEAVSRLVLHPDIDGAVAESAARGALDARIRGVGQASLPFATFESLCREAVPPCRALARLLSRWLRVRHEMAESQSAAAWSRTFSALLEALGWPGERALSSVEYQALEAWKSALSQFAGVDAVAGTLALNDALSLVRRMADETIFQPETGDVSIEVLGTMEASGLRFDRLWIAGLSAEAWPGPPKPNPFLPIRMQREAGLPRCSPERELAFSMRVTERLLASAPEIVVSHPLLVEGNEAAPSPLIQRVPKVDAATLARDPVAPYAELIRPSRAVETFIDERAPALAPEPWQRGGAKVFQYQSACPFRAFAELRLGAAELDAPEPGLNAQQRGTLVHAALEEFWKQVRTQAELRARADIAEVIGASATTAIERIERDTGALPARFREIEQARIEHLLEAWLALEKERSPFEVLEPERERYAEIGGIRARVKIDRIDRLPDGRDVIVDYKTGAISVKSWEGERPKEPQVPLYGVIHERPLAAVLFGQIKAGEVKFRGFQADGVKVPGAEETDLGARIGEWRAVIERLASEFREGRAEVDPKKRAETCRYCPLPTLCRIDEAGPLTDDEEEAE